jgi:thioredoxin-like negative regulator of GroEL
LSDVLWVDDVTELQDLIDSAHEVVVDFTAPSWCRPCQQFAPHFDKAAEKSDATFVAVDVDKAPWAMADYGVRGVPTVMLYQNGEYVKNLQERSVIKLLAEINS